MITNGFKKTNCLFCKYYFLAVCLTIFALNAKTQNDSVTIRVHFLHGSKPKHKYKHEEDKWFGGMLGGHAGVEYEPNKIFNFQPSGRFHVFRDSRFINSHFGIHDTVSFYSILGGRPNDVKKTIVSIKISSRQKKQLDSVVHVYTHKTPYDYAFFGYRCGAAAYDVLAHIGVVKKFGFKKTYRKIFYPRKLRRRLEHRAIERHYKVVKVAGSKKRKWERD